MGENKKQSPLLQPAASPHSNFLWHDLMKVIINNVPIGWLELPDGAGASLGSVDDVEGASGPVEVVEDVPGPVDDVEDVPGPRPVDDVEDASGPVKVAEDAHHGEAYASHRQTGLLGYP